MILSPRSMACRLATIQGCPGTWLKTPKDPYLPILSQNTFVKVICIGPFAPKVIIVKNHYHFQDSVKQPTVHSTALRRYPPVHSGTFETNSFQFFKSYTARAWRSLQVSIETSMCTCTMALPVVEFSRQGYKIGKVFKVDYFILPLFLVPKLKSVTQNEWKKHPDIFFLLLNQK